MWTKIRYENLADFFVCLLKIEMKTTYALLKKEIENHIPLYKLENSFISNTNVGWQIEHILLTIDQIVNGIQKNNQMIIKPIFYLKTIVLQLNIFPRGKLKHQKQFYLKPHLQKIH